MHGWNWENVLCSFGVCEIESPFGQGGGEGVKYAGPPVHALLRGEVEAAAVSGGLIGGLLLVLRRRPTQPA